MANDRIQFGQRPYVRIIKDMSGVERVIKRRPPKKMHDILPSDEVELNRQKNSIFEAGESYSVKHISRRAPNILQLVNDDGDTTFVPYFEVELDQAVAPRNGVIPGEHPRSNRYLRWP